MTTLIDPFTGRMRSLHSTNDTETFERARDAVGKINIYELLLGTIFVFPGVTAFGLPMPASQLAAMGLVGLGLIRGAKRGLGPYAFLPAVALIIGGYLLWVSVTSDYGGDYPRRFIRLALGATLMFFFVSRRLDIKSVIAGAALGCLVNVPLFYAGLAPNNYGGYLTGFFNDKNVAGLSYAVFGVLFFGYLQSARNRALWITFIAIALWFTGSRTSMAGFVLAIIWILTSPRLSSTFRWLVAAFSVWFIEWVQQFADDGVFAARKGSDLLRERVGEATAAKLDATPWYGRGLGNAYTYVGDLRMFFHNSYDTLQVDGGYPYLWAAILVTVFVGLRPFRKVGVTRAGAAAEASILVIFVCATRLGEVMLTTCWFLAMAAVMTAARDASDDGTRYAVTGDEARTDEEIVLQYQRAMAHQSASGGTTS